MNSNQIMKIQRQVAAQLAAKREVEIRKQTAIESVVKELVVRLVIGTFAVNVMYHISVTRIKNIMNATAKGGMACGMFISMEDDMETRKLGFYDFSLVCGEYGEEDVIDLYNIEVPFQNLTSPTGSIQFPGFAPIPLNIEFKG